MENTAVPIKKKKIGKFWKYLIRIFLSILIFFVVLIGTATLIIYFSQEKIKKFIVSEINKELKTEIKVKDVDLSLFHKFPFVSLTFTDVTAKDAITSTNKGDLLIAEHVYLQFNIWDLFTKDYKIKRIDIKNATLTLLVYKDSTDNYHFWKADTTKSNDKFSFDLQKVVLDNVNLRYINFAADQDYSALAKDMVVKGKFRNDDYSMYVNGDLFINYINITGVKYLPSKNSTIDLVLHVNEKSSTYTFKEGGVNIGNLKFDLTGDLIYTDIKHNLSLKITGADLKLQSFLDEIPKNYRKYFEKYKGKGEFYFNAAIVGSFAGKDDPVITIDFGISKGEIIQSESDISLENVSFTGKFTNGYKKDLSTSQLEIKNFYAVLKSGIFSGNLLVKNFTKPSIELIMNAKMDLKDLHEFLKPENITSLSGSMDLKVSFRGTPDASTGFTAQDFLNSKTSGTLKISNTELTLKDDPRKYTNINGDYVFNNNDLVVNKMSGKILSSDFSLKGYFRNLLSYLFLKDQPLMIDADLISVNTNLDELLKSNTNNKDSAYKLTFSNKLNVKLNVDIGKLTFNKFSSTSISGKVLLKDMQLLISPLSFSAVDGKMTGLVMIDGSQKNKLLISCEAKITDVNITKLFYEFNNFGQTSLKDENLKGSITSEIQFASVWSKELKPDMDKIYAKANITIKDGELLNYAPMKGLSKFIKVNALNDVKFATLHNQIEIKNKTITFPAMDIKSTAIDIVASGEHKFDNSINYSIKLLLSELMARKAKSAKKENEEFGVVEDDNLGKTALYILVTGTVDNPVYKYDAKGVRAKIAVSVIKEKQNLKTILNDEFGWFKKDTALTKKNKDKKVMLTPKDKEKEKIKKQEDGKFIIEWGDTVK